jgi:hypothetical protein
VHIITQNIDNLHEQAGSSHVLHLHGEVMKARSTGDVYELSCLLRKHLKKNYAKSSEWDPSLISLMIFSFSSLNQIRSKSLSI